MQGADRGHPGVSMYWGWKGVKVLAVPAQFSDDRTTTSIEDVHCTPHLTSPTQMQALHGCTCTNVRRFDTATQYCTRAESGLKAYGVRQASLDLSMPTTPLAMEQQIDRHCLL